MKQPLLLFHIVNPNLIVRVIGPVIIKKSHELVISFCCNKCIFLVFYEAEIKALCKLLMAQPLFYWGVYIAIKESLAVVTTARDLSY